LKGTRRSVLQQLEDWLHDEQDNRFFWLSGSAGSGKSAIAQTFAEICFAEGILGASFFCSRKSRERSNAQLIFPTLAFQLAHRYPRFREELLKVLRTNPDVRQQYPSRQLENLIAGPFEATQIQTLIIIDALDECDNGFMSSFPISLRSRMHLIPNVKFFITGRPVGSMASELLLESHLYPGPLPKIFSLHDVDRSLVEDDIKLILRTRLREHVKAGGYRSVRGSWPNSKDLDTLCRAAGGSFVCASKSLKHLTSQYDLTTEVLVWRMNQINKALEQR